MILYNFNLNKYNFIFFNFFLIKLWCFLYICNEKKKNPEAMYIKPNINLRWHKKTKEILQRPQHIKPNIKHLTCAFIFHMPVQKRKKKSEMDRRVKLLTGKLCDVKLISFIKFTVKFWWKYNWNYKIVTVEIDHHNHT